MDADKIEFPAAPGSFWSGFGGRRGIVGWGERHRRQDRWRYGEIYIVTLITAALAGGIVTVIASVPEGTGNGVHWPVQLPSSLIGAPPKVTADQPAAMSSLAVRTKMARAFAPHRFSRASIAHLCSLLPLRGSY